jgi:hypothetical protein
VERLQEPLLEGDTPPTGTTAAAEKGRDAKLTSGLLRAVPPPNVERLAGATWGLLLSTLEQTLAGRHTDQVQRVRAPEQWRQEGAPVHECGAQIYHG